MWPFAFTLKYHIRDPEFAVVRRGTDIVSDVEVRYERDVGCHRHHVGRRYRRQQRVRRRKHLFPTTGNAWIRARES